jgi:hypothetical protein
MLEHLRMLARRTPFRGFRAVILAATILSFVAITCVLLCPTIRQHSHGVRNGERIYKWDELHAMAQMVRARQKRSLN